MLYIDAARGLSCPTWKMCIFSEICFPFKIAKRTEVFRQENGKKNKKKNKIEDYYSSSFF
jgi:hypothetical protein